MSELNNNIEKISSFFKKLKPSLFLIKGHVLENEEEYSKEIYATMLYAIAASDGNMKDGEKSFMERLIQGLDLQDSSKYIKRVLNVDEELISEFLRLFSGTDYAHNFFVDSLILKGSGGDITEKSLEIIAEYAEVLTLSKEEVGCLSELAMAILEHSNEKYHAWLEAKPKDIKSRNFLCYSKGFASGIIARDEDYEYWTGRFELNKSIDKKYKDIEIEEADINIAENCKLNFNSCSTVSMKKSKFKGYYGIDVKNGSWLEIKNSTFKDFSERALGVEFLEKVKIENSKFLDCFNKKIDNIRKDILGNDVLGAMGGALYAKDIIKLYINSSTFKNCSVEGKKYGSTGAAIYINSENSEKIELKSNIFTSCNKEIINGSQNNDPSLYFIHFELTELILENNRFQNCERETNI